MHARCKANKEGEKAVVVEQGKAGAAIDERGGGGWKQEGILGTGNFWQVGPRQPEPTKEKRAMGLKYTREDAEFMCSHTWLVLTCEIVS